MEASAASPHNPLAPTGVKSSSDSRTNAKNSAKIIEIRKLLLDESNICAMLEKQKNKAYSSPSTPPDEAQMPQSALEPALAPALALALAPEPEPEPEPALTPELKPAGWWHDICEDDAHNDIKENITVLLCRVTECDRKDIDDEMQKFGAFITYILKDLNEFNELTPTDKKSISGNMAIAILSLMLADDLAERESRVKKTDLVSLKSFNIDQEIKHKSTDPSSPTTRSDIGSQSSTRRKLCFLQCAACFKNGDSKTVKIYNTKIALNEIRATILSKHPEIDTQTKIDAFWTAMLSFLDHPIRGTWLLKDRGEALFGEHGLKLDNTGVSLLLMLKNICSQKSHTAFLSEMHKSASHLDDLVTYITLLNDTKSLAREIKTVADQYPHGSDERFALASFFNREAPLTITCELLPKRKCKSRLCCASKPSEAEISTDYFRFRIGPKTVTTEVIRIKELNDVFKKVIREKTQSLCADSPSVELNYSDLESRSKDILAAEPTLDECFDGIVDVFETVHLSTRYRPA
eukprot:COSAG01_NODE_568_length_15370_cov_26.058018_10_plen_520_part_00